MTAKIITHRGDQLLMIDEDGGVRVHVAVSPERLAEAIVDAYYELESVRRTSDHYRSLLAEEWGVTE